MQLNRRIPVPLKKERISRELTVSNNSLRVVTEQYFCLALLTYIVDIRKVYEQLLMHN